MKMLTIGGSGFVSGTLTRLATDAGHDVWSVTRGQRPVPNGITVLTVDRHDRDAFAAAVRGLDQTFDLVVDCIGYHRDDAEQDIAVFRDLADHLVFVSTDFVYDPRRRNFPTTVDHEDFLTDDSYGAEKRRCEVKFIESDPADMKWTVVRPCHIYGPGSQLGCLPAHSRDARLLERMKAGQTLDMVGGGYFLQQPIYVEDLARTILSCAGNAEAHGRIFLTAGPDIIESHSYYRIIAEVLGVDVSFNELPVTDYLAENPHHRSFLCHRFYDLSPLRDAGLHVPNTPLSEGLRRQTQWLLDQ